MDNKANTKKISKNISNVFVFALLLLLIFSPDAKAWFLKQLISVGLFKAEIKNNNAEKITASGFAFQDENGNIISTKSLKGKVVLINFWASWCPPCRAEMSSLNKLYNQFKADDRVVFLFMNEDEDRQKAEKFLRNNNYAFPTVTAKENVPPEIFKGTLPTTIVLDKEGKIMMKHEGLAGYDSDDFVKQFKGLL